MAFIEAESTGKKLKDIVKTLDNKLQWERNRSLVLGLELAGVLHHINQVYLKIKTILLNNC